MRWGASALAGFAVFVALVALNFLPQEERWKACIRQARGISFLHSPGEAAVLKTIASITASRSAYGCPTQECFRAFESQCYPGHFFERGQTPERATTTDWFVLPAQRNEDGCRVKAVMDLSLDRKDCRVLVRDCPSFAAGHGADPGQAGCVDEVVWRGQGCQAS